MKVLLVRPPYTRLRGAGQAAYFPLGLGFISSYLRERGHDCVIYNAENRTEDEAPPLIGKADVFARRRQSAAAYREAVGNPDHPVFREVREVVKREAPDLIGVSLLTAEFASALACSRAAKAVAPTVPIIWGGAHASFLPESCLAHDEVDYVARGEGEGVMEDLCRFLASGDDPVSIPGLSYRNGSGIRHNSDRPLFPDLDALPPPDRTHLVFPERFDRLAMGSVIYSRGCPFKCTFCSSRNFWQKRVRFRGTDAVVDEVASVIEKHDVRSFTFWDDTFTINRQVAIELCNKLKERCPGITFKTATRADVLDDEILTAMKEAGCIQLQLGIETGSPRMSRLIEKEVELKAAYRAVRLINRHGIAGGTFFIVGYPQETLEDMEETFQMMKTIGTTDVVLNVFDPMPGSALFETAKELGLLPEEDKAIDWTRFALWPEAHYVKEVPPEAFNRKLEEMSRFCERYNGSFAAQLRRLKPQLRHLLTRDRATLFRKGFGFVRRRLFAKTPWPAW